MRSPAPAGLTCLPSSSSRQTCASRLGCPLIKNAILLPIEAKAAMLLHVKVQQLDRTALMTSVGSPWSGAPGMRWFGCLYSVASTQQHQDSGLGTLKLPKGLFILIYLQCKWCLILSCWMAAGRRLSLLLFFWTNVHRLCIVAINKGGETSRKPWEASYREKSTKTRTEKETVQNTRCSGKRQECG